MGHRWASSRPTVIPSEGNFDAKLLIRNNIVSISSSLYSAGTHFLPKESKSAKLLILLARNMRMLPVVSLAVHLVDGRAMGQSGTGCSF